MTSAPRTHHLDEDGRNLLNKIQQAFSDGKVTTEVTESNGNTKYKNQSLDDYVLPLKKHLNMEHIGYTAWKISTRINIKNQTGPEYIIPITDVSDTACLVPGEHLMTGTYVYHAEPVDLIPSLVCLFVTKGRAPG